MEPAGAPALMDSGQGSCPLQEGEGGAQMSCVKETLRKSDLTAVFGEHPLSSASCVWAFLLLVVFFFFWKLSEETKAWYGIKCEVYALVTVRSYCEDGTALL